ncbi:MAG: S-layer homology domain-containing protein, partial [Clostridia bacterium]|nr:S-layer homology domain-containing protein [Clostridia bacterium]
KAPEGYPFEYYKATGFNAALVELIKIQDAVLSTDGGKIMPWIGLKSWSTGGYANFWSTNYYDEFVLHTGLMNPDPFLIYNIGAKDQGTDEKLLTRLFNQLDELVGFDDRKPLITKAFSWDQRYLLTGMYAGGKNVWRITPDLYTPGVSQENFLINKEKPTFQIGNQVVVFPEGSYIYQPTEKISDYGYWVVSPQNTYPEELRIVGMDIPKEPILGSDKIPIGHTYENSVTKYTPDMQTVSADKAPAVTSPADKEPENNTENNTEETNSGNNNTQKPSQAQGHWAQASLDKAVSMGFLKGTDKGLMPDRNIQRAEFITMLLRAMSIETNETVGATWYAGAINAAKEMGWIEPYDDGPTILTREETARILVRAFQIGETSRRVNFTDIDSVSANMHDAVLDAASSGMINGYPDGTFKPQGNITRAEAVTMILRCIK